MNVRNKKIKIQRIIKELKKNLKYTKQGRNTVTDQHIAVAYIVPQAARH